MARAFYTNTHVRLNFRVRLSAAEVPVDLTDAEFTMTFKRSTSDEDALLVLTSLADGGLVISDPAHGVFYADLTADRMNAIGPGTAVFDIIRTDGGKREPFAVGSIPIKKGVS